MEEGQWAWGTITYWGSSEKGKRVLLAWVRNGWAGVEVHNRWAPSQVTRIVTVDRPADPYAEKSEN